MPQPTQLRNLKLNRCDLVDDPANQHAHVLLVKRASSGPSLGAAHVNTPDWLTTEKAVLSTGQQNALPDSAFAAVWTDADGKKQRKLPFKRADGSTDLPHLRNALARFDQTNMPSSIRSAARSKLDAAARQAGVGDTGDKKMARKVAQSTSLLKRLARFLKNAEAEAEADAGGGESFADWANEEMEEPDHQDGNADKAEAMGQHVSQLKAHLNALKVHHADLGKAIDAYGDTSKLPADHPVHALKALHKELGEHIVQHEAMHKEAAALHQSMATPVPTDKEAEFGLGDGEGGIPNQKSAEADAGMGHITKRLRTALAKQHADLKKRADQAEARAKAAEDIAKGERDLRVLDEVKTELRKFRHVQIDIEKEAPVFKKLREHDKPLYDAMVAKLAAANEVAKAGKALTQEIGSSADGTEGGGSASAWARIEASAEKMFEKSTVTVSKQKAIDKFMQTPDGKKLVAEYNAALRREQAVA